MTKICPKCGGKLIEIVYGMPAYETFQAAERGEVYLGGCMMDEYKYHCNKCNLDFTEDLSRSHKEDLEEE